MPMVARSEVTVTSILDLDLLHFETKNNRLARGKEVNQYGSAVVVADAKWISKDVIDGIRDIEVLGGGARSLYGLEEVRGCDGGRSASDGKTINEQHDFDVLAALLELNLDILGSSTRPQDEIIRRRR